MPNPLWQPRSDLAARALGVAVGFVGLALLYWQVLGTLRRMEAAETPVEYSLTLILCGEMFLALGGFWLVRGLAGYAAVRNFQHQPRARKILVAATLVLLGLSWWFMHSQLASHGYESP